MAELVKGSIVQMKYGGEAKVLDVFGAGGQGTVYKVSYRGKEYALKWYHNGVFGEKAKDFYKNLENNIDKGAPDDSFLWPLDITKVTDETFGYIMNIRPHGYHELTEFFVGSKNQKQVRFKSFHAIADAAINIVQVFRALHNSGYSYQDINNGNFFINPDNGDVLICDNDNVSPYGTNLGILGKQRYMAPEIVLMKNDPDKYSDRFSLAVILFRLLFVNHPLEGRYSTPPCMTKQLERKYYGEEPIFIYDPEDSRNRPVPGTDKNLKLFWSVYPEHIRALFTRAFSKDALLNPNRRPIEKDWLNVFMQFKAEIVFCPHCGKETFVTGIGANKCIECNQVLKVRNGIQFNSMTLPLYRGVKIMLWHADSAFDDLNTQIANVVANPMNPEMLGLQNVSNLTWNAILPDGTRKTLAPEKVAPVKTGITLNCTSNPDDKGEIV